MIGATQLFRNREIWGIDATYSEAVTSRDDEDEEPKRYIPTGAVQREYPRAISSIRQLAAKLDYGDRYTIEMGFSGAEGVHLAIDGRYVEPFPGPFYDKEVFVRKAIPADYPTKQIMNNFWDKLFSEVGRQVPKDLVWKPDVA